MITDDDRCHRRKILLVEVGDDLVPAFFAGPCIERDQVIVGRFQEQVVVPHSHSAIADVRAAFRLPEVVPQHASVTSVNGPCIVRSRDIEDSIDLKDRTLDGPSTTGEISTAFTTDDRGCSTNKRAWACG